MHRLFSFTKVFIQCIYIALTTILVFVVAMCRCDPIYVGDSGSPSYEVKGHDSGRSQERTGTIVISSLINYTPFTNYVLCYLWRLRDNWRVTLWPTFEVALHHSFIIGFCWQCVVRVHMDWVTICFINCDSINPCANLEHYRSVYYQLSESVAN